MRPYFERIGKGIAVLRADRSLLQKDLAALAGISQPQLSRYERGRSAPTLELVDRLLKAMDADANDLAAALARAGEVVEAKPLRRPRFDLPHEDELPVAAGETILDLVQRVLSRMERAARDEIDDLAGRGRNGGNHG